MPWKLVLSYSFENHAALDESGNGNHGMVHLPAADRWVDAPIPGVATAIRFDDLRSKVVVATRPSLAGWPGFQVRALFRPDPYARRINLVEAGSAFALFVEPDGKLMGTIYDGHWWYGVSSAPGFIQPGRWYSAQFLYDTAQVMVLRVNGALVDLRPTKGAPVHELDQNGIQLGYWPGGDDRYTFAGLLGPVAISSLDPRETLVDSLRPYMCPEGTRSPSRVDELSAVVESAFTAGERDRLLAFQAAISRGAGQILAGAVDNPSSRDATVAALYRLAEECEALVVEHRDAQTDVLSDPRLAARLTEALHALLHASGAMASVVQSALLDVLAALPLTETRRQELLAAHPELGHCAPDGRGGRGDASRAFAADPAVRGILDRIERVCAAAEAAGGDCAAPPRPRHEGCEPPAGSGCHVHVHIHQDGRGRDGGTGRER
jgi:hypothetical protein